MITSKIYNIKELVNIRKANIIELLNYEFKDNDLLLRALTHSSLKNETNINIDFDNEKLEFIGDAVLDLIVSNFLLSYLEYSHSEGTLSINRARIVNEKSLFLFANKINLDEFLFVSKSGKKMSIQKNPSVLADSFEALVGAIYLDSNFKVVEDIIINKFQDDFINILNKSKENYKGIINEVVSKMNLDMPTYEVINILGPDHNRTYKSKINISNKYIAIGTGNSIKESEQNAAKKALILLKED